MKIYMGRGKNIFISLIYSLPFALCFALPSLQRLKVNSVAFFGVFLLIFPLMLQHFCTAVQQRSAPARGSFLLKL